MLEHIKEAEIFYQEAMEEFKQARERSDEIRARDACSKAWFAVAKATESFFIRIGIKGKELPKAIET